MKLASLRDGSKDGRLLMVSRDLSRVTFAKAAQTLSQAIAAWDEIKPRLEEEYLALNSGNQMDSFAFNSGDLMAPLPRTSQFIDASAFLNHGNIMEEAYKLTVEKQPGIPVLIQRQSDDFKGPCEDYEFPDEADNADFEGEIGVVLSDVPMGCPEEKILDHVILLTLFNDVSMRTHLFRELQMGFGFILAKPATVFAPVMVTPDELGDDWHDGRVHLDLHVAVNGKWFGQPNGREMDFSMAEIIRHITYNRNLTAGTIIGTGTFSNKNYQEVGSACLAERRAIEVLEKGESVTPFLKFGDQLKFEMFARDGRSLFGAIEHKMVQSESRS
jgi:fumarylacetoacetate (FAA) hydrolase